MDIVLARPSVKGFPVPLLGIYRDTKQSGEFWVEAIVPFGERFTVRNFRLPLNMLASQSAVFSGHTDKMMPSKKRIIHPGRMGFYAFLCCDAAFLTKKTIFGIFLTASPEWDHFRTVDSGIRVVRGDKIVQVILQLPPEYQYEYTEFYDDDGERHVSTKLSIEHEIFDNMDLKEYL